MIRDLAFRIETIKNNEDTIDPDIINIYEKLIDSAEKITISESKNKIYRSKEETLKELSKLIQLSKMDVYQDLKIDSTFIQKIGEYINKEWNVIYNNMQKEILKYLILIFGMLFYNFGFGQEVQRVIEES